MTDGDATRTPFDEFRHDIELSEPVLASTLSALVAVPSVNPGMSETLMVKAVSERLADLGCRIEVVEFAEGRPSLAAVLEGTEREPRLVLNGHMDTVAVDDASRWTVDPFGGEIRSGAVWGRGALDMKGGLTAQIACARVLAKYRPRLKGSLILHFAAGEECGEPGTKSLLESGFTGDWGITTEPTDLTVATAERGVAWFRIRIDGRSCHASQPHTGLNPVLPLTSLLEHLDRYASSLRSKRHPLLGSPTCTVTSVHSGVQHNAVPDYAEILVDRRLLPSETTSSVTIEIDRVIDEAGCRQHGYTCERVIHHHPFLPAEVDASSSFVATLQRARDEVTGSQAPITGTAYGSDVRNLIHDAGMEAVTFGPGDAAYCHCVDEHLATADLRSAALALTKASHDLLT